MSTEDKLKEGRRNKLDKLLELGVDPYGGRFENVEPVAEVRARAEALNLPDGEGREDQRARLAGRIVLQRGMGNLVFLTVRDGGGDIQCRRPAPGSERERDSRAPDPGWDRVQAAPVHTREAGRRTAAHSRGCSR